MSGPTTVIITTGNPAAVLLAAAAIRAAQAVALAAEQAAAQRAERQAQADHQNDLLRQATQAGGHALGQVTQSAEVRFARLQGLAAGLGLGQQVDIAKPVLSVGAGHEAQAAYARSLEQLNTQIEQILLTEAARQSREALAGPDFSQATAEALSERLAVRLLARLAHLQDVPTSIHALAKTLDDTPPGARADMLATELRAQIQRHAEATQQRELREAQALVLEQSLKDLGYQVEPVTHTLFVEGGVVHFRRSDWGAYMVRLRVAPQGASINFNVVRAVAKGQNERSVLDHLAEDRWCAEFPALLKTLEARGLHLDVTRRLQAGEVPVQCVAAEQLPRFADDERPAAATERQGRNLP